MAQKGTSTVGAGDEEARVHIVYTQPPEEEPEAYHVRTLTSVLGRFDFLF